VSSTSDTIDVAAIFGGKSVLLTSLTKGFVAKAMKLLVTMSTLLTSSDYQQLGPHLWEQIRNESDSSSTAAVCFFVCVLLKLFLIPSVVYRPVTS
jgi:uncharacterized membrane protein required for colicin V production